ncbi:hypothetical protein CABS01_00244 [Colletotrichum abscissum]|uniref:Uncharacterized protein n=1 Tax=Colletotrichum tamarilloi TaxID=1209934 RepID=A0ABQ9RQ34_9PEZI|nr:uncharacterized protein CTAM01_01993 [Colletotrichum tamarilloi]XP_060406140.1 uncharacterized protein CABS01_00244 [Colletotrichum abscissum]KAK1509870.1 hypothetical protein CTAM01_01993 [Colletotrichum tamarilloi]KAK1525155.1 hypothetical protein CABS01_00244 [Colletotrichum abscissum]
MLILIEITHSECLLPPQAGWSKSPLSHTLACLGIHSWSRGHQRKFLEWTGAKCDMIDNIL